MTLHNLLSETGRRAYFRTDKQLGKQYIWCKTAVQTVGNMLF